MTDAERFQTLIRLVAKYFCALLSANRKFSCAALIASALDGLSVTNPRSSSVNPVSPANKEAKDFN